MPLARFESDVALANMKSRESRWPDGREMSDRLKGIATVVLQPSFEITRADRIFTMGSCFAREIENRLSALGFDLPMAELVLDESPATKSERSELLNKYTVHSMANEIEWALDSEGRGDPQRHFIEMGPNAWYDGQLVPRAPALALIKCRARRAQIEENTRQVKNCRIVILTLGLAESWFDKETGIYLNAMPPPRALSRHAGRFALDVLSYEEILLELEKVHELLSKHGHPDFRMLLTVSPIPFKATFTGQDALTANTYSKSVQRAAAEAFVRAHPNVDYFPSYEIVTLTNRDQAFTEDQIHVERPVVAAIMDRVMSAYAPGLSQAVPESSGDRPSKYARYVAARMLCDDLYKRADYGKAALCYGGLLEVFAESMTVLESRRAQLRYARSLARSGDIQMALQQLRTLAAGAIEAGEIASIAAEFVNLKELTAASSLVNSDVARSQSNEKLEEMRRSLSAKPS